MIIMGLFLLIVCCRHQSSARRFSVIEPGVIAVPVMLHTTTLAVFVVAKVDLKCSGSVSG